MTTKTTRDRLRTAAAERFGRRGYDGTSMADLAERIGVTKATLYSHYSSKEALLLDLFEEAIADWMASAEPALGGDGSFLERLRRHLEASLAWCETHPHQAAIVQVAATRIGGELGRRLQSRLDQLSEGWAAAMTEAFAAAARAGDIPASHLPALLELWSTVADGLFSVAVLRPEAEPRPRARLERLWPALERAFSPTD
jgi:AcrR family transcriptional regulator